VWLKVWSSAAEDQGDDLDMFGYLRVYGMIGMAYAVLTFLYLTVLWSVCAVRYGCGWWMVVVWRVG
jgi:hypothetical protein